jgi:hypothetical protein
VVTAYWGQGAPCVGVPAAIFPEMRPGMTASRVFTALAIHADDHTGQVAADACMSRTQVARGIKKLIESGWIKQVRKGYDQAGSSYRLHWEPISSTTTLSPGGDR